MSRPERFDKVDLTPKRHHGYAVLIFILGTFFPPLAVAARFGIGGDFWLNLLLTICGYFPGHGHNFYIQNIRNNKNNRRTPKWAIRYGLVDDTEIKRRKKRSQWASRYDERLPESTLVGQQVEDGQTAAQASSTEVNNPNARQTGPGQELWREQDEGFYNAETNGRARPAGSLRSDSSSGGGRWHYPANFDDASVTSLPSITENGGKKKKSKKTKDTKDRWARTSDAHSYDQSSTADYRSSKKKSKKSKKSRTSDGLERTRSTDSGPEGPEDAVGGLYGDRTAPQQSSSRGNDEGLNHQF